MGRSMHGAITSVTTCLIAQVATAQPSPDGFDWVTIGATGNPSFNRPDPTNYLAGRGSVDYAYRLGRTEVTTAQRDARVVLGQAQR